jgi:hypothetical protein
LACGGSGITTIAVRRASRPDPGTLWGRAPLERGVGGGRLPPWPRQPIT